MPCKLLGDIGTGFLEISGGKKKKEVRCHSVQIHCTRYLYRSKILNRLKATDLIIIYRKLKDVMIYIFYDLLLCGCIYHYASNLCFHQR